MSLFYFFFVFSIVFYTNQVENDQSIFFSNAWLWPKVKIPIATHFLLDMYFQIKLHST